MADPAGKIELFYSYSHSDEDMREHLEKHLSILRRTGGAGAVLIPSRSFLPNLD